jgi:hypothetical protein
MMERGVATMRVIFIYSRSSMAGIRGAISFFRWSLC